MYRRCTLGEISSALEESWGRHRPSTAVVRGAYSASFDEPDEVSFRFQLDPRARVLSYPVLFGAALVFWDAWGFPGLLP